jgi:DNA-binding transcriptional MocR family regulator
MSLVWQTGLPTTDKIVLLALADCANEACECWPSIAHLAKKCSLSERSVYQAIAKFIATGWVTKRTRPGRRGDYRLDPGLIQRGAGRQRTPETPAERKNFSTEPSVKSAQSTPASLSNDHYREPSENHHEPSGDGLVTEARRASSLKARSETTIRKKAPDPEGKTSPARRGNIVDLADL